MMRFKRDVKQLARSLPGLIFTLAAALSSVHAAPPASICDHVSMAWLKSHIPVPDRVKLVFKKDQGGICEAVFAVDGTLVPVYAGKDFIVVGQMYKNGVPVTRVTMSGLSGIADDERKRARARKTRTVEMRKAFFKIHAPALADLVSVTFSPGGTSDKFFYVISDPACSHCKTLLDGLEEFAVAQGLCLKLVLYPVLGKESRALTAHVICHHLGYGAYKTLNGSQAGADDGKTGCKKAAQRIDKTFDLLKKADISIVPLVVAQDGSWVVEGNDICAVRRHLGLKPGTGEKWGGCKGDVKKAERK